MTGAALVNPFTGSVEGTGTAVGAAGFAHARGEVRPEELALIAALQAGSDDAFRQLILQYSNPLYSFIARSLPNPADAADVTQDVFIKVFRSIASFHGDSSLRTWMYRIAMHEASNSRRWWSRHKKPEVTIDDDGPVEDEESHFPLRETLADPGATPLENVRRGELRAIVEEALRELPESFRTVVLLREIEGMAYDEIADILSINIGTVKSRLLRGRAALRTNLAPHLHEFSHDLSHTPAPIAAGARKRPQPVPAQMPGADTGTAPIPASKATSAPAARRTKEQTR